MSRPFNGSGEFALVSGACTGAAPRFDFCSIGHIAAQFIRIFKIDNLIFIGAEEADFTLWYIARSARSCTPRPEAPVAPGRG